MSFAQCSGLSHLQLKLSAEKGRTLSKRFVSCVPSELQQNFPAPSCLQNSASDDRVGIEPGQCTFFEQFDANGDGNVDLGEFRSMIRTSRKVSRAVCSDHDCCCLPVQGLGFRVYGKRFRAVCSPLLKPRVVLPLGRLCRCKPANQTWTHQERVAGLIRS